MEQKGIVVRELGQYSKTHTIWISEQDGIASFHAVEGYMAQTFVNYDFFMSYIRSLQDRRFRFQ